MASTTNTVAQRAAPADPTAGGQQLAAAPEPGPLSISRQVPTAAAMPMPLPPPLLPLLLGRCPAASLPRRA